MGVTPDDAEYPTLRERFLAYYAAGLAETTALFDGIAGAARRPRRARACVGASSPTRPRDITQPVVDALGLIGARRRDRFRRHDARIRNRIRRRCCTRRSCSASQPAQCVYVGDDLRDVIAGNAAGMPTIVAEYGYLGERGCADDWPATGWIATPLALLDWLPDRMQR